MSRFVIARCLVAIALFGALSQPLLGQDPPSAVGPLLKLYRSGRLPEERQPTVVEMICGRGNEHDLRVVFDKLVAPDGMTPALRQKAINGLVEAANGRNVKPAGDLASLAELLKSDDAKMRLGALKLAAACRVEALAPAMREMVLNPQATTDEQRAALAGLISIGGADNLKVLEDIATSAPSIPTRMQAAAGLVGVDVELAANIASEILLAASPADDPGPLLDAFFQRKDGADRLAAALSGKALSVDVAKRALRTMYSVGRSDASLSDVLSAAAGIATDAPPPTPEEVSAIVRDVSEKGDAARGEAIFRRADVSCMRCHSVSRAGGQVGPDLSAVGGSSPTDYIANSILNPNLAVKEQYVTRVFETSDGLILTGVLIDRDDSRIRIRDAQGKIVVIPASEVEAEAEGPTMMPTGLTKFLTRDELIDLVKFVSELGKPGDYAVQTVPAIQRWRVLQNTPAELTSSVPHLDHVRDLILNSDESEWLPAYAKVAGMLPLAPLFAAADAPALILRGEVQVNEAGLVHFTIESGAPTQVWIDAQPFLEQREFDVKLESGRHAVILRLEASPSSEPELRVRVTKPEGSTAQLEVVGGQ